MEDHYENQAPIQAGRLPAWSHPRLWWESKRDGLALSYIPPFRLLVITLGSIFFAEVVAMVVIAIISKYSPKPIQYYQITLIDAGIMTILIFPVLYHGRRECHHIQAGCAARQDLLLQGSCLHRHNPVSLVEHRHCDNALTYPLINKNWGGSSPSPKRGARNK